MAIKDLKEFKNISDEDTFTIVDHMVYREGQQIPFIPHDKRAGRSEIDPKFFVYHYTAGRFGIDGTVNYLKNVNTKADVHLILDVEGNLVQMAPLNEKCWHAGKSSYKGYIGLNSSSCGIEVINPGPLDIIDNGVYKTWFGKVYINATHISEATIETFKNNGATIRNDIIERAHQLHPNEKKYGWLPYSKQQLNVMTNLAQAICHHYDAELVGHDEITTRKRDPGPLSEIDRMREMIEGRDNDGNDTVTMPAMLLEDEILAQSGRPVNIKTGFSRLLGLFRR